MRWSTTCSGESRLHLPTRLKMAGLPEQSISPYGPSVVSGPFSPLKLLLANTGEMITWPHWSWLKIGSNIRLSSAGHLV